MNFQYKLIFFAQYLAIHSTFPYTVIKGQKLTRWQWFVSGFQQTLINMNLVNTQVQMRKGILEYCILNIISRGEVYASDMLDELTSAKIMVVEGTLYPLLTRLRKAGLVEYKWVESTGGPPRKYYTLTSEGQEFLASLDSTWKDLVESTEKIKSSIN